MRALLTCIALPLTFTASALAQQPSASQQQNLGQQVQQQNPPQPGQIQENIRQNLQAAGFTDIRMMPSSFMVRAKDRDGNPVMMLINPDSIEAMTFEGGTGQPQATGQGTDYHDTGNR
jgi:hypothetical protein